MDYLFNYDKIKEDLGFHGCLWWIIFAIYKLIVNKFTLLASWKWWLFLLIGMFLSAALVIPWYFIIRGLSKLLTKTYKTYLANTLRWIVYMINILYIILIANWIFNIFV